MAYNLRVYWPTDAQPRAANNLRLAFQQLINGDPGRWDQKTIREYSSTINLWESLTDNPPVDAITDSTLQAFRNALAQRPGRTGQISPNTIRKHLRQLRAIFRELGPRRNGRGLAIMSEIPYAQPPKPVRHPPTTWTPDQFRRLVEAAEHFTPGDITSPILPPTWWRALMRLLYNTAFRIGTALALRWEWLQGDGWVNVPPEAIKMQRTGRRFYLNAAIRKDLAALPGPHIGPILPWNATRVTLERWRRRLQRRAGLPDDFRHGFHCVRRTALTAIARINPLAAKLIAGHAQGDVLAEYYFADEAIVATLEQLPQPF